MTKEFLTGVKTEGLVTMIRQHLISEWGAEGSEEKVVSMLLDLTIEKPNYFSQVRKARETSEAASMKSGGELTSDVFYYMRSIRDQKGLVPL